MPVCALCGSPLSDDQCPFCSPALRQAFGASLASSFSAAAMPPAGVGTPSQRSELALLVSQSRLAEADTLVAGLVRTLRPLGVDGRLQLSRTLEAWAQLKAAQSLAREAEGLHQRALSAGKDPQELRRKQAAGEDGSTGWDNHAWVRLQAAEAGGAAEEGALAQVRRDLDQALLAQDQRQRRWKVGFCALSGFACAVFVGLSPALGLLGAIAGALVGWRWSVKG